jgi:excisionase family DNA binding protein
MQVSAGNSGEKPTKREKKPRENPMAFTVNEYCDRTGISRSSFYKYVALGKIRTVMVAGRRLVPAAEEARLLGEEAA